MILKCIDTGMLSSNSYIVGGEGEGVVIDAGAKAQDIISFVEKENLSIKYIILTHAHIDHIAYVEELREKLGAKTLIHEFDAKALSNPLYNGSALFGLRKIFKDADVMLKDGDIIEAGGLKLQIIHTPGHTSGGICIKAGKCLFSGDTLFRMSIGRTDLGDGNMNLLIDSIENKLMKLDDDIVVYPGHGEPTSIGFERESNPFI